MSQLLSLGIDTSHNRGQLLLWQRETLIGLTSWEKSKSHSEKITLAFEELLQQSNKKLEEINQLACVIGPGSFTGIRVGVNFSKALAYARALPLLPINSLDLLALSCLKAQKPVIAMIDAQKNSVFLSSFNAQGKKESENQVVPIQKLKEFVTSPTEVCGNGLNTYKEFLDPQILAWCHQQEENQTPDLKLLVDNPFFVEGIQPVSWQELNPLYIKASAPEEKLNPTQT